MTDEKSAEKPECSGCKHHNMSYLRFQEYSRVLHQKRIRQKKCPVCGLWTWPEHLKAKLDEAKP